MAKLSDWVEAARPRTLPAAVAPVLVGSGLAQSAGVFRWDAAAAALLGALAIQVGANFANDASDAARGADPAERVGPTRLVASGIIDPRSMWTATWTAIAVAALAGAYLISIAGWIIAWIGIASVVAMLTYVGGPIPYGYRALGEVAVFVFFGLVATVGSRLVHDRTAGPAAWWLGAAMGCLAAAILVANNLRDRPTDASVGKRTLAVVLGDSRSRRLYAGLLAGAFGIIAGCALIGVSPRPSGLAVLVAPLAWRLANTARRASEPRDFLPLLGGTARLQLVVGVLLALGAALTG